MKNRASRVWDRMQEMFGNTFTAQYGHVPLHTWSQAIAMLSDDELIAGMKAIAMSGETFPPTLPKFIAYCQGKADGVQTEYAPCHKLLERDPPETEQQIADRKERGREHMAKVKEALRKGPDA